MSAISHNAPKIVGMNFQGVSGTATIKIRDWNRGTLQNCYIYAVDAPCIDAAIVHDPVGDAAWWHLIDVHFGGTFSSAILSDQFTFQMLGGEMTADDRFGTPANRYGFVGTFVNCSAHGVKTDGVRHIIRGMHNHFSAQCEIQEGETQAWLIGDESWKPNDPEDTGFAHTTRGNTFNLKITGRGGGADVPMHFGAWATGNHATLATSNSGGTYTEDAADDGSTPRNTVHMISSDNYNDGFKLHQPVSGYVLDVHNGHLNAGVAAGVRIRGTESTTTKMLDLYSPNGDFEQTTGLYYTGDGTLHVLQNLKHGAGRSDSVAPKVGFFNTAPIVKPTGVAVTAEGIHAALVALGLIGA
jgi:hypothetical protein